MSKQKKTLRGSVIMAFAALAIYSCTHVSGTFISTHGSMQGSSMKDNCMDCHMTGFTSGGFIVAGTVFKEDKVTKNPNGDVILYSADPAHKDSVVATIEVDGVGNFYTTHPYDLSAGVIPAVRYGELVVRMESATPNGACNSCHDGHIQDKIHIP